MNDLTAQINSPPTLDATIKSASIKYADGQTIRHSDLTERSFSDQHPISAITGLSEKLQNMLTQETLSSAVESAVAEIRASGELKGDKGDKGDIGPQGEKGKDGSGITIIDSYASEDALRTAHPQGNTGDAYMVNEYLYIWSESKSDWTNIGNIEGAKGDDYILTNDDIIDIANIVLSSLPVWNGGNY